MDFPNDLSLTSPRFWPGGVKHQPLIDWNGESYITGEFCYQSHHSTGSLAPTGRWNDAAKWPHNRGPLFSRDRCGQAGGVLQRSGMIAGLPNGYKRDDCDCILGGGYPWEECHRESLSYGKGIGKVRRVAQSTQNRPKAKSDMVGVFFWGFQHITKNSYQKTIFFLGVFPQRCCVDSILTRLQGPPDVVALFGVSS